MRRQPTGTGAVAPDRVWVTSQRTYRSSPSRNAVSTVRNAGSVGSAKNAGRMIGTPVVAASCASVYRYGSSR